MYDITNPKVKLPDYTAIENIAEFVSYCQKQQGEQFHLNVAISLNNDGLPEVRFFAYFKDRIDDGSLYETFPLTKTDKLEEVFKILANKSEFSKVVFGDAKAKLISEAKNLKDNLEKIERINELN